jgi:hypothetical protein
MSHPFGIYRVALMYDYIISTSLLAYLFWVVGNGNRRE